jgi:predicted transcriptional regulator
MAPMSGFTMMPTAGFSNAGYGCTGGNAGFGLSFGMAPGNQGSFGILDVLNIIDRIASRTGGTGGTDQVVQKLSNIESKLDTANTKLSSIDERLRRFNKDQTPTTKPKPPGVPGTDTDPSRIKEQLPIPGGMIGPSAIDELEKMKAEMKREMNEMETRLLKAIAESKK